MKQFVFRLAAAGVFTAAGFSTAAAQEPNILHFSTTMTAVQDTSPYTGSLDLNLAADGTLHGYYFPSDYSAMFVPVVGGRTGNFIWFDIGSQNIVRVQAQLRGGRIDGGALDQSNNAAYAFTATPAAGTPR